MNLEMSLGVHTPLHLHDVTGTIRARKKDGSGYTTRPGQPSHRDRKEASPKKEHLGCGLGTVCG